MKLNERIIYFLLNSLSHLIRRMNPCERVVWAQKFGGFAFHYIPVRKSTALQNIGRAFPDKPTQWKTQILKKCYTFFMEQFLFFFGFPESYTRTKIRVKNKNVLDEAMQKKRGVLYISGHFGFWECNIAWFGRHHYPLTGIAQRQKNEGAHQFFIKKREKSGIKHVFRKDSLDKMNRVLDEGGILGIVSDQDAKSRGVFVRFFNILSSTPKGAARFYQHKGAIPIFGVCTKEGHNQFLIKFKEIPKESLANTETFTQAYTQLLENEIRTHPEQYFWWHNRWKTPPPGIMSHRISSQSPDVVSSAANVIKSGGIIAYPTDTLYGFGGDASNGDVVEKINKIKNRSGPVSVLVSDMNMAFEISDLSEEEKTVLSQNLSGKNTIIVPAKRGALCPEIFGSDHSVGIRIPDHPFGKNLVQMLKFPITTTSINRTGELPLNDPDEIMKQFGNQINLLIDEGPLPHSKGSSIFKLEGTSLKLIR